MRQKYELYRSLGLAGEVNDYPRAVQHAHEQEEEQHEKHTEELSLQKGPLDTKNEPAFNPVATTSWIARLMCATGVLGAHLAGNNSAPPPVTAAASDEPILEKIVAEKILKTFLGGKIKYYLVKWEGDLPDEWRPATEVLRLLCPP